MQGEDVFTSIIVHISHFSCLTIQGFKQKAGERCAAAEEKET